MTTAKLASPEATATPRVQRNQEIECLRGVAIVAVMLAHIYNLTTLHAYLPDWLGEGGAGVQLFFVISGFVVGTSLLRSIDKQGYGAAHASRTLAAFYLRRVFRLAPMALVGIATTAILYDGYRLIRIDSFQPFISDLLQIVTLRLNYALVSDIRQHPLAIFWSLMVEEHFYLVLPMLLLAVRGFRSRVILCAMVILVTVFILRPGQFSPDIPMALSQRRILYASHLALDFFAVGVLIAVLRQKVGSIDLRRWRGQLRAIGALLTLFVIGLGQSFTSYNLVVHMPMLLMASGALVFVAAQESGAGLPGQFGNRLLAYVGSRSYGLYLLHYPTILWFQSLRIGSRLDRSLASDMWPVLAAMLATFMVVEVLHHKLEQPMIDYGAGVAVRRLASRA